MSCSFVMDAKQGGQFVFLFYSTEKKFGHGWLQLQTAFESFTYFEKNK